MKRLFTILKWSINGGLGVLEVETIKAVQKNSSLRRPHTTQPSDRLKSPALAAPGSILDSHSHNRGTPCKQLKQPGSRYVVTMARSPSQIPSLVNTGHSAFEHKRKTVGSLQACESSRC